MSLVKAGAQSRPRDKTSVVLRLPTGPEFLYNPRFLEFPWMRTSFDPLRVRSGSVELPVGMRGYQLLHLLRFP